MEFNRKKMLAVLRGAARIEADRFFFCERELFEPGRGLATEGERFIMPLRNAKRIAFASGGRVRDRLFEPGEVLFCRPGAWTCEYWDRDHEMLSVVFYGHFIRVLYIHHNGMPPDQNGPDIFFHTASPLSGAALAIERGIFESPRTAQAARALFQALLAELIDIVEHEADEPPERERFLLDCARGYMEENLRANIGRDDVAAAIHISSAYLTWIFRKNYGGGFSAALTKLRMEQAARLLRDPSIAIGRIAALCGYAYPSYFIRIFRKYYAKTPARFRAESLK